MPVCECECTHTHTHTSAHTHTHARDEHKGNLCEQTPQAVTIPILFPNANQKKDMLVPVVAVLKSTPVETGTLMHPGWVWPETHLSGSKQSR